MESSETTAPIEGPSASERQVKRASGASLQRVIVSIILFIVGVLVGGIGVAAFFVLGIPTERRSPLERQARRETALTIQASTSYVNQVVQQKSGSFEVPGTLKNLQVSFVHEGPVTISGEDELNLLGLTVTRQVSMDLQLYADACKPMAHILRANFSGIPITGFVASFEQTLNQQLQSPLSALPAGFTYCITAIHTEPQGATILVSAQPAN